MLKKKPKKREFKPKPWLKKPEEEKVVMVYGYVKSKNRDKAKADIDKLINDNKW